MGIHSTTATYDALGRMVEKGLGGVYTQFSYRPDGVLLALYSGAPVKTTIPLPGGSTAIYNSSGLNYIRHTDWLGSSRFATTWNHTVYSKEAYAPFGETYNEAGTPDRSFTGQDQDVVTGSGGTGVYDFLFRKYDPSAGRWLSPDPSGWQAASLRHPQSLNRYAYAQNNPLSLVDPSGLNICYYGDPNDVSIDHDAEDWSDSSAGDCAQEGGESLDGSETITVTADGGCSASDPNSADCLQLNVEAAPLIVMLIPIVAPSNDPCSNSQLASVGVGPAQLRQRIGAANIASNLFGLLGYASLVRTGGPQDDKNLPQNHSVFGPLPNAVAAGNISFGVTCPFGAGFCQFAAGAAQTLAGHPDPNGTLATGFDTPSDNAQIKQGQAMRAAGCHN